MRLSVWPDIYQRVLTPGERCDVQCIRIYVNNIVIQDVSRIELATEFNVSDNC